MKHRSLLAPLQKQQTGPPSQSTDINVDLAHVHIFCLSAHDAYGLIKNRVENDGKYQMVKKPHAMMTCGFIVYSSQTQSINVTLRFRVCSQ